ncbi:MAG: hypothetical protein JST42_11675 [Bacteroidetes bacterium]|nr:hypothetical protein [Bacteroidota bacterium]
MKKIPGLLLILLPAIFAGCQKSAPSNLSEINAHVIDGGDPAVDGKGIYIRLDASHENVVPINLPAEYQQKGINSPVALKIVNTGGTKRLGVGSDSRIVYIVSIRKL